MKKKYCAPVIKAVLFKAEEAVSACIIPRWDNPTNPRYELTDVTPESGDDIWTFRNNRWYKVPETALEWLAATFIIDGTNLCPTEYIYNPKRPNHS